MKERYKIIEILFGLPTLVEDGIAATRENNTLETKWHELMNEFLDLRKEQ